MKQLTNILTKAKLYISGKNKLILILWGFLIVLKIYESQHNVPICNVYNIYTQCPDSLDIKLITDFGELHE